MFDDLVVFVKSAQGAAESYQAPPLLASGMFLRSPGHQKIILGYGEQNIERWKEQRHKAPGGQTQTLYGVHYQGVIWIEISR